MKDLAEQALEDNDIAKAHVTVRAPSCDLPLRQDVAPEDRTVRPPEKDIHKTAGGKIVNTGIYYGLGWLGNSALALYFTYGLNPKPQVIKAKENATKFIIDKVIKNPESHGKTYDSVRSTVELLFMFISGTLMTGLMTPLVSRRGKLAHKVNNLLHNKDAHVLPDEMKKPQEPKTLEDKLEQEINKRVNKHHSTGDLWTARAIGMGLILGGDYGLNRLSQNLEKKGGQSVDTLSWRLGQKIHDGLQAKSPKVLDAWINFFEKHGAEFKDVKKGMKEKFDMLQKTELQYGAKGSEALERRMVISEQTRLVTKEAGWTMVMALMLHEMVKIFNKRRVKKEEAKAVAEVTKEGLVPEGYKVVIGDELKLERDPKSTKWADKNGTKKSQPVKQENFVASVDNSRAGLSEQHAIN